MKFHTAEYLSDIFEAADDCGHVSVQIFPIKLKDNDEKQNDFQAENIVETMPFIWMHITSITRLRPLTQMNGIDGLTLSPPAKDTH